MSITSAIPKSRRKPNLRGQDGRVVKAGALGGAHVKSWDQTWSIPDFPHAHREGLVLKIRPLVTVAGVSQIWGQDGRVVKAGTLGDTHDSVAWDRTWSSPDSKKVYIGRCVGFNHVRNSIWQA